MAIKSASLRIRRLSKNRWLTKLIGYKKISAWTYLVVTWTHLVIWFGFTLFGHKSIVLKHVITSTVTLIELIVSMIIIHPGCQCIRSILKMIFVPWQKRFLTMLWKFISALKLASRITWYWSPPKSKMADVDTWSPTPTTNVFIPRERRSLTTNIELLLCNPSVKSITIWVDVFRPPFCAVNIWSRTSSSACVTLVSDVDVCWTYRTLTLVANIRCLEIQFLNTRH